MNTSCFHVTSSFCPSDQPRGRPISCRAPSLHLPHLEASTCLALPTHEDEINCEESVSPTCLASHLRTPFPAGGRWSRAAPAPSGALACCAPPLPVVHRPTAPPRPGSHSGARPDRSGRAFVGALPRSGFAAAAVRPRDARCNQRQRWRGSPCPNAVCFLICTVGPSVPVSFALCVLRLSGARWNAKTRTKS